MFNKKAPNWFLFFTLVIEGGALMAVELIGAKMIAPYYGTSLYVWASVLAITLGGLAIGYYTGGLISKKQPNQKTLYVIVAISAILVLLMPITSKLVLAIDMGLRTGIIVSCIFFLMPQLIGFGMVSPMVVRLISENVKKIGSNAGTVYFTSTIGGILSTFFFGFYSIPYLGLMMSALLVCSSLLIPVILFPILGKGKVLS